MLHILFLILKIIGIILLIILGITLTLVGVVLFVPIRYRVKTETTNGMKGLKTEGRATWLLHLISAQITYQDEKWDWIVRVGWKKIRAREEDTEIAEYIGIEEDTDVTRGEKVSAEKKVTSGKTDDFDETDDSEKDVVEKENWFKKIKCTILEICDKIKNIKEYLTNETHIQAFLRLKKELVFFVRKIKPDKINGYLRFGLEDPYNTGQVLAVLSVLYPFYGEHFQVYPEFEQKIIEGDVFFKGRIHFMHLLLVLGRLYFDKNVKTAYKNYKTIKG